MASVTEEDSPPGTSSPGSVRPGTISKPPSVDERRQKRMQTVHGTYTREEERQVLRKIDIFVLPMMCFVFFMQYLDKQSLSYASVFGLITDLNMTSVQYSWCSSIFYVGQLVAEYPFIFLMSKLPLTKFVGATVIIWGAVCLCLAAPHDFGGFAAVRFLLGFTEGAVSPAFVTMTSIWYQKGEHATRTAIWVSMNGTAQVIGCLLMYAIGRDTSLALQPWRALFLVCGAMTMFAGGLFYCLMPSGPKDAWFLTPRDKEVLALRMAGDREGGDKTSFSVPQLVEAVKDPKAWFVFAFGVLVTMQSPVLTFASLVINTIGYDKYQTMLYTAPSGAIQVAFLWFGVFLCWLFPRDRTLVVLALIVPPLIGNCLLLELSLDSGWGMIAASWMASCISASMSPLLSLTASNVKGNTKRSVVSCMFFIGYCAGCIASPQLWTVKPRYFNGVVTAIVTWCLLFVVVIAYRVVCQRDNARRDRVMAERGESLDRDRGEGSVVLDRNGLPKTDLTDKEDLHFRYCV